MPKIHILIVEDEPMIAEDLRDSLTNINYEVAAIAYNKPDALEFLSDHRIDLVMLDINLGGNTHGLDIAKFINQHYRIPFVFLTSYATEFIVQKAKYTRPMAYLVKPFDEKSLYSTLEIALYNHAQSHLPRYFNRDLLNTRLHSKITEKEFELLQDIYDGKTNKQMMEKHYVTINTVKTHIQSIYLKLDTNSRISTVKKIRDLLVA